MEFILAFLVLLAAFTVLAYPLYRAQQQPVGMNASTLDDLLAQRDGIYATLRDLELDKQLGKLDEPDYNALHEKYLTQAAGVLQELDLLRGQGNATEASAEIEKEIAALRRTPANTGAARVKLPALSATKAPALNATKAPALSATKVPALSATKGQASGLHCKNCGRAYDRGDKFCVQCGRALT
ncbi:MAG: hypothetical protein HY741_16510 [Chloroflexi bacterium]|nr:hypothetical protein [Chloroflexota bacterium]